MAAELSLAMIEQSLLDRFPSNLVAIQEVFQAGWREPAVRTASSITFADHPATQPINPRLLAEEDRPPVAAAGAASGFPHDTPLGPLSESLRSGVIPSLAQEEEEGHGLQQNDRFGFRSAPNSPRQPEPDLSGLGGMAGGNGVERFGEEQDSISQRPLPPQHASAQAARRNAQLRGEAALTASETAYWNPAIVTDKDGKATVTLVLPEQSTAWRLVAKGITADTLAGEAAEKLAVKKELFGELALPPSFTDGDKSQLVAAIHNDSVEQGKIEVTLKTTIGDRTVEEKKTLDLRPKSIQRVTFGVEARSGSQRTAKTVDFTLTVGGDVLRRCVPLAPYGMPVYAAATGSADTDTTVWVESPSAGKREQGAAEGVVAKPSGTLPNPTLSIFVGPTIERSLLDTLFGTPPECQLEIGQIASDLESATSDLMASIGLQKLLGALRKALPEAQAIDARIRASASLLIAAQNDDGGWG